MQLLSWIHCIRGVIRKFAEKYYHSFISYAIPIKFSGNIAQFNSSKMTNLYPNRANNERNTISMATSLHGTRPKTFYVDVISFMLRHKPGIRLNPFQNIPH